MIFWPCGICRKNCKIGSICCDNCDTWYHIRCEELELADVEMFITDKKAGEKGFNYRRFCCKREKGMLPTITEAEYSEEKLVVHLDHATSKLLLESCLFEDPQMCVPKWASAKRLRSILILGNINLKQVVPMEMMEDPERTLCIIGVATSPSDTASSSSKMTYAEVVRLHPTGDQTKTTFDIKV
ncbi:unnamed protein product [Mytilus coruscus]|uniref:Zinc finger PHD-type domain-containing protein n=1 Tax=Mytilus coruscus TaxID=42192 RepID=A0A6J8BPJ2_MYTCO|nr:unnamed protein product [Mytilus coruscus]